MSDSNKNTVFDAIYILNDILDSLVAGTMVFDGYQKKYELGTFSQQGIVAVQKMCVSHLILALSKIVEFWKHYHQHIPEELRPEIKAVVSKLKSRDIQHYRNTVVAHIRDKKLNRARTQFEAIELLNRISDENPRAFLAWINSQNEYVYPKTVASIVETLRDNLRMEHRISASDVFDR